MLSLRDLTWKSCLCCATDAVLAILSIAGIVLALVNTSILHDDCGTADICDTFFRRFWWTLMFHIGVMGAVFLLWMASALKNARIVIVGFLALVTTQLIEVTGRHLTALDRKSKWPNDGDGRPPNDWIEEDPLKIAFVGYLVLAFVDMAYIVLIGMEDVGGQGTGLVAERIGEETSPKTEVGGVTAPETTTDAPPV